MNQSGCCWNNFDSRAGDEGRDPDGGLEVQCADFLEHAADVAAEGLAGFQPIAHPRSDSRRRSGCSGVKGSVASPTPGCRGSAWRSREGPKQYHEHQPVATGCLKMGGCCRGEVGRPVASSSALRSAPSSTRSGSSCHFAPGSSTSPSASSEMESVSLSNEMRPAKRLHEVKPMSAARSADGRRVIMP